MTTAAPPDLPSPPVGTVLVWSDLLCPFTFALLHMWSQARVAEPELADVRIEHHVFPLELFNGPHPRRGTDTEAVGLGQVVPSAGFTVWVGADDLYPHTVLLAEEAVLAASAQSPQAGELLDMALRQAFWTQSRTISHRGVIDDVIAETTELHPGVIDPVVLCHALDEGVHRPSLARDHRLSQTEVVPGSPTVVLPGGIVEYNPGIEVHWEGPWARGFPIVDRFDTDAQIDVLRRALTRPSRAT